MADPPSAPPNADTKNTSLIWGCSGGCLGFIAGAFAMAVFAVATFPTENTTRDDAGRQPTVVEVAQGETAEYAGFSITIDDVEEGARTFDGRLLAGSGEYTVVTFHVENTGDRPHEIKRDIFFLLDEEGAEYGHDSGVVTGRQDINPGNGVVVPTPFDVPAEADITHVLIRDEFADDDVAPVKIAL